MIDSDMPRKTLQGTVVGVVLMETQSLQRISSRISFGVVVRLVNTISQTQIIFSVNLVAAGDSKGLRHLSVVGISWLISILRLWRQSRACERKYHTMQCLDVIPAAALA